MDKILKNTILSLIISVLFIACGAKQDSNSNSDNTNKNSTNSANNNTKQTDSKTSKKSDKDELTISTPDGKQLSANFSYSDGKKDSPEPLVILVHQFNQTKEQWKQDYIDSLIAQGYKVLAYDIRGHGKSSKVDYDLNLLLEDPKEAPMDITGVINWAATQKGIDTSRIAVIGTSIGGNVALYAKYRLNAKVAIAISNSKETFEKFVGFDERSMGRPYIQRVPNVFLLCGSKDDDHEAGQKFIYDTFLSDPKDMRVFDSDKHGMYLIEEHPEINALTINWLKKNL